MTEIKFVKVLRRRSTYDSYSGALGRFSWGSRYETPYVSVAYPAVFNAAYRAWKNYEIHGDEPEDVFIVLLAEVLAHEFFHAEVHKEGLHLKGRRGRLLLKAEEQVMILAGL